MVPRDSILNRQIDEYLVVKLLGKGGMARVYQAIDVNLNRSVAIKVIDKPHRSDVEYVRRFKQEARAIGRLDHPNIVRLYRYGEADELVYMAMQYIEGLDLGALLQSYRKEAAFIELGDVVRLNREICSGLDYAHSQGVIHRDLKPSNIMIDRVGNAILTDFGLAMLAEVTTQGQVLGSPEYISPEQAVSSANAVPQSDLYSMGVVLFEMLTGKVPFSGADLLETAMMHIEDPVPLPSLARPDLGREFDRVLLKCLDKNPKNRFQTGAELAAALEKAVDGIEGDTMETIPARVTIPERVNLEVGLPPDSEDPPPQHVAAGPSEKRGIFNLSPFVIGGTTIFIALFLCVLIISGSAWIASLAGTRETAETPFPSLAGDLVESSPTLRPSPTPSTTLTPTPTRLSQTPTASQIPATFTSTPAVIPTGTPFPVPPFSLTIASHKSDSMVLRNDGENPLDLPSLVFRSGNIAIEGADWEVDSLLPGECVIAVKSTGNPKLPDLDCEEVGERLKVARRKRIWDGEFDIFYGTTKVADCDPSRRNCEIDFGNDSN